jgi:beta-galactosidase
VKEFQAFFRAFHSLGIPVEVLSPDADLSSYDLIAAPLLQLTTREQADRISERIEKGATLIGTSFSFLTDELDLVWPDGAPGPLRRAFGISVEETDALPESEPNEAVWPDGARTPTRLLADRVRLEGASVWAVYGSGFYCGEPVLTRNRHGAGEGVYLASMLDDSGLLRMIGELAQERRIGSPLAEGAAPPQGLEVSERRTEEGKRFLFLISRSSEPLPARLSPGAWTCLLTGEECEGVLSVAPGDVRILSQ